MLDGGLISLISAFVVRFLDSTIPLPAIVEISRLYLVSVAEQTGLSLTWSQTPNTGFLVTRLISSYNQPKISAASEFIT